MSDDDRMVSNPRITQEGRDVILRFTYNSEQEAKEGAEVLKQTMANVLGVISRAAGDPAAMLSIISREVHKDDDDTIGYR